MKKLKKFVKDGFKNIIKGLGDSDVDPRMSTTFVKGRLINQQIANDLYVYNWIAAKGVDIPVDDATRKWRSILISDADEKKNIEEKLEEYDIKGKFNLATKWSRVFGGAVIIVIIDNEDPSLPMNIESIRPGSLKNFIVLDRYKIIPGIIDRNILSDNYGNPEYYQVTREGVHIHHSRIIKFNHEVPTILEAERNQFWGVSIFSRTFDSIADSGTLTQSIGNLVSEASVDVYMINELNSLVAEGNDDVVVRRLRLAHEMKSVVNGIALDGDDKYDKKSPTFAQLPEIDDRFMQKISGAFDIPLTRFLGISPSGLNATGDSDMMNYYDNISSLQENYFRPKLDIIDEIIAKSEGIEPFEYEFRPLQQLTETEQTDVDLKNAQKNQIYLDYDVIKESDVLAQLVEDGTYVSLDESRVEEKIEEEKELEFGEGESESDPDSALNGAQVTAMLEIVRQVTSKEIDKETAAKIIAASFPMSIEQAQNMLKEVTFEEKNKEENSFAGEESEEVGTPIPAGTEQVGQGTGEIDK